MARISRRQYADLYGPTVGDRFRLADTELVCEVEQDFAVYGDELVFGGGKTARDGMGQGTASNQGGALDLVITNVVVMDPVLGVIKGDLGVKDGLIVGIGKAGNPGVMDGVFPDLAAGPGTEVIAGEHLIATPGGVDTHIHMIAPGQVGHALSSGITTMIAAAPAPPKEHAPPPAPPVLGTSAGCWRPPRPCRSTGVSWGRAPHRIRPRWSNR